MSCRVRLPFRKKLPIITFQDGVDWVVSCCDGLLQSSTDIYDADEKTEAAAIEALRHKIAGIATEDASLYRSGGWTEKGAKCYRKERDAVREYLPEGWFEFVETAQSRMPPRLTKKWLQSLKKKNVIAE